MKTLTLISLLAVSALLASCGASGGGGGGGANPKPDTWHQLSEFNVPLGTDICLSYLIAISEDVPGALPGFSQWEVELDGPIYPQSQSQQITITFKHNNKFYFANCTINRDGIEDVKLSNFGRVEPGIVDGYSDIVKMTPDAKMGYLVLGVTEPASVTYVASTPVVAYFTYFLKKTSTQENLTTTQCGYYRFDNEDIRIYFNSPQVCIDAANP